MQKPRRNVYGHGVRKGPKVSGRPAFLEGWVDEGAGQRFLRVFWRRAMLLARCCEREQVSVFRGVGRWFFAWW